MILVTRLNGAVFALNPDLVERADCTPDTVITLIDGTKYVIAESVPEFIDLVRRYRASVIAAAQRIEYSSSAASHASGPGAFVETGSVHPDGDEPDHDGADGPTGTAGTAGTAKIVQLHRRGDR